MSWTITIPDIPPSLNQDLRRHWSKRQKEKKRWFSMLFYLVAHAKVPAAAGRRRVTIERRGHGILDYDNLVASCKAVIIDNLRPAKVWKLNKGKVRRQEGLGLIRDDSPTWVEVDYRQVRVPRGQAQVTVLTIEEAPA
jgi:hypothetical protein